MISFKKFYLGEEKHNDQSSKIYNPTSVSDEELIDWCEKHAPNYLKNISKHPIWRGMDERVEGLIDTNKFNRVSANTYNHYTIWMDNHPSWAAYPKRSKALICSTSQQTADGFGSIKLIIPADTNKIGVCPHEDLWVSFPHLFGILEQIASHDISLDDVTSLLHEIVNSVYGKADAKKIEEDFGELSTILKKLTPDKLQYYSATASGVADNRAIQMIKLADAMNSEGIKSMYELFERGFDPKTNNFKLITAANSNKLPNEDLEVWIQGECAVIDIESLRNREIIDNFRKKYNIPMR